MENIFIFLCYILCIYLVFEMFLLIFSFLLLWIVLLRIYIYRFLYVLFFIGLVFLVYFKLINIVFREIFKEDEIGLFKVIIEDIFFKVKRKRYELFLRKSYKRKRGFRSFFVFLWSFFIFFFNCVFREVYYNCLIRGKELVSSFCF